MLFPKVSSSQTVVPTRVKNKSELGRVQASLSLTFLSVISQWPVKGLRDNFKDHHSSITQVLALH